MSDIAIQADMLGKRYRIGAREEYYTLRETLVETFTRPIEKFSSLFSRGCIGAARTDVPTIWALKDVSFEVKRGDVVGIIGPNGAGKSTLLKILSRITEPTEGRAKIHGRVGSLLEVGTGFHWELTGRENLYLSAAILGMKKAEIKRKFDEIVAFGEIGSFLDTPVKRYSSGMYMRLAFAIAAHLDPEILIIDEVLAVGDAAFQKKCLGKMEDVAKQGRTVLFVSHNMAAIQNLCNRALVFVHGRLTASDYPTQAIQKYLGSTTPPGQGEIDLTCHPGRQRGSRPLLRSVRLLDRSGAVKNRFQSGDMVTVEIAFEPVISLENPEFEIGVDDWTGTRIFSLASFLSTSQLPRLTTPGTISCRLEEIPLEPGRYMLSLSAGTVGERHIDVLDRAVPLEIDAADFFGNGKTAKGLGRVLVRSQWSVQH